MRVLTVSSLYPNSLQENFGVFVENRMKRVHQTGEAHIRVIAPVPWFPCTTPIFGRYAILAKLPKSEQRFSVKIDHPRYLMLPKIGLRWQARSYALSLSHAVAKIEEREGKFDLIDAHYLYPDGVAASLLAAQRGLPLVLTARGSDVTEIAQIPDRRRQILQAAACAHKLITVCEALRERLIDIGVPAEKIITLRNGIDLDEFHPPASDVQRQDWRKYWEIPEDAKLLVSVGGLIERKGHHITLRAIANLPDIYCLIAGEGPMRAMLEREIDRLGLAGRVRLLGNVAHGELYRLYGAADISVLSSSREGWANVLLESMACGTPVVATAVWGTPEIVNSPEAGNLISDPAPDLLARGIVQLLSRNPSRRKVREYAEKFSWEDTITGLLRVFAEATS